MKIYSNDWGFGVLGFWGFGAGLMAIEWIANAVSGTNDLFLWIDDNISSFGAYGAPYQDGFNGGDIGLVLAKIAIFLIIGFAGFRNRSLNLR